MLSFLKLTAGKVRTERSGILELEKRQRSPLTSDSYRDKWFQSGNPRLTAIGSPNIPRSAAPNRPTT
ncbi:hypothetical protein [Paenibacillus sp. FSL L8-0463]|uniref:hypothetical protein n=1 Tax=Paenibacillus sp. FSL L8-0463 TaxID=2954687 RepID=UPI0031198809